MSQPQVAVILVNHREDAEHLEECMASLGRQRYPRDCFTVFIVNNGVSQEGRRLVAQLAPTAHLLSTPRNLGWGAGNNRAVKVALKEGFEYLVMLNTDTVVDERWLPALVEAARAYPDRQILQSKLLLYGTQKINSLGNRLQFLGYSYCLGYGREEALATDSQAMDCASGASMLVKREVFEAIGLFRGEYFMYYDDVEFCWRARLAGFNVALAGASVCYHKYDVRKPLRLLYYVERNRLLTLLALERVGTLLLIIPGLCLAEVVGGIYFALKGWSWTRWQLLCYFTQRKTWRSIRVRRRQIHFLRKRKDAEVVKTFAGHIVFAQAAQPVLRYFCNPLLRCYWAIVRTLIVW